MATVGLVLVLLYTLHREHTRRVEMEGAVRVYITGAAAQYQRAILAEGRLNSCMAQF